MDAAAPAGNEPNGAATAAPGPRHVHLARIEDFVPELVVRQIARTQAPDAPPLPLPPWKEDFVTAALFGDVSGFTSLAERLAAKGGLGAERLAHVLNRYFDLALSVVSSHGGDVVKYAGDAMIVLWPPPATPSDDWASHAVKLAARCAITLQLELARAEPVHGIRFSVKLGIGVGLASLLTVGGIFGRKELISAGTALV
jgi:class 3 adenylate cyclase